MRKNSSIYTSVIFKVLSLVYSKSMLFIYDNESKLYKVYIFFNKSMSPNNTFCFSCFEPILYSFFLFRSQASNEQIHSNPVISKEFFPRLKMLPSKYFSGRHYRNLNALFLNRMECGKECYDSFTCSNITLK